MNIDNNDLYETVRPLVFAYNMQIQLLIDDISKLKIQDDKINVHQLQKIRDEGFSILDGRKRPMQIKKAFAKVYDEYTCKLDEFIESERKLIN